MRCLTLANALSHFGIQSVFLSRHSNAVLCQSLEQSGHRFCKIGIGGERSAGASDDYAGWLGVSQVQDAQDTLHALSGRGIAGLVVDHYALDAEWESKILEALNDITILALDDLCRRHSAQIIVDPTFARSTDAYASCTGTVLAGSSYAHLRPEFAAHRDEALRKRRQGKPVECVLLAMGGADPDDLAGHFVKTLAPVLGARGIRLEVLTGAAYAHVERMQALVAASAGNVFHHHNTAAVAPILLQADLCIGAAGSSSWERCCLGLPTISIVLAENQNDISQRLSRVGAVIAGGSFLVDTRKGLLTNLEEGIWHRDVLMPLIDDAAARVRMSEVMAELVDGHGAMRVATCFAQALLGQDTLWLRPAGPDDSHDVYRWRYADEAAKFYSTTVVPDFAAHQDWYCAALGDPSRRLLIAQSGETGVAHLRFDLKESGAEVGICVNPEMRGKKFGQRALAAGLRYGAGKKLEPITARVHERNEVSVRLFTSAGFVTVTQQGPFLMMRYAGHGGCHYDMTAADD